MFGMAVAQAAKHHRDQRLCVDNEDQRDRTDLHPHPAADTQDHNERLRADDQAVDSHLKRILTERQMLSCIERAQNVHGKIADQGSDRRALRTVLRDQDEIEHDVGQRSQHSGQEGENTLLRHKINTAEIGHQRREDGGDQQNRNVDPCLGIGLGEEDIRADLCKGDQPRAGEKHQTLKAAEDLREEGDALGLLLAVTNGGKLPCLNEDGTQQGQQGRDLIGSRIETVDRAAADVLNEITVGHTGDPPEYGGGDHGNAVIQHTARRIASEERGTEIAVKTGIHKEEDRHQSIGDHNGENIAEHAHLQRDEENDVQQNGQRGIYNSLHREQRRFPLRTQILRAQRVEICRENITNDQPDIIAEGIDQQKQRRKQSKQKRSAQKNGKAGGEDLSAIALAIHGEAENTVSNAEAGKRNEKIGQL